MPIVLAGIVLGFSLIVAVGPQNVYIIKQGIRREGITAVILACTISDIFLITAGTAGVGVLVEQAPIVLEIMRWGGAAYLLWFAFRSFKDAINPQFAETVGIPRSGGAGGQDRPAPGSRCWVTAPAR